MDIKVHKQYQDTHWWFKVRDNLLQDIALKYFPEKGRVLDFGCNFGHSVKLLQNLGYMAEGLDISQEPINYGKSIGIENIFVTSEKTFSANTFDAAIVLDVLEHIKDDKKAFQDITSLVKPGGIVVFTVPVYMFLWSTNDEISHHYTRYATTRLINLSKELGDFEIMKKSYFNTILFLPIAIFRILSLFWKNKLYRSDLSINNEFINKLFFTIFDFERKILKHFNFPFGVSALIVLRKK